MLEFASLPRTPFTYTSAPQMIELIPDKKCFSDIQLSNIHAYAGAELLAGAAVSGLLLTTSNGVIYDGEGNVVKFKGIGWFGFNSA